MVFVITTRILLKSKNKISAQHQPFLFLKSHITFLYFKGVSSSIAQRACPVVPYLASCSEIIMSTSCLKTSVWIKEARCCHFSPITFCLCIGSLRLSPEQHIRGISSLSYLHMVLWMESAVFFLFSSAAKKLSGSSLCLVMFQFLNLCLALLLVLVQQALLSYYSQDVRPQGAKRYKRKQIQFQSVLIGDCS